MPLAVSISARRGPTPRTYMMGVSRPGTPECYRSTCGRANHLRWGHLALARLDHLRWGQLALARPLVRGISPIHDEPVPGGWCVYGGRRRKNHEAGGTVVSEVNRRNFLRVAGSASAATL